VVHDHAVELARRLVEAAELILMARRLMEAGGG